MSDGGPPCHATRRAFCHSLVRIDVDGRWLELTGTSAARRPPAAGIPFTGPVVVLTAWNPHAVRRELAPNLGAQAELEAELDRRGLRRWPAVGMGDACDQWAEASVAVTDLGRAAAQQLARTFGQAAYFEWRPTEATLGVVWPDGQRDDHPVTAQWLAARPCPMAPPARRSMVRCAPEAGAPGAQVRDFTAVRAMMLAAAGCDVCQGPATARHDQGPTRERGPR